MANRKFHIYLWKKAWKMFFMETDAFDIKKSLWAHSMPLLSFTEVFYEQKVPKFGNLEC